MIDAGTASTVTGGSLVLALPIAAVAGLVSFLSPCVLPLVPGYLSYVTGLSGADLAAGPGAARGRLRSRMLLGCVLFVLGFSVIFVTYGTAFGAIGRWLFEYQHTITKILGAITIALGLVFMGLPGLQRTFKSTKVPAAGLVGAPLLGALFGFGWTPCIGPTLAAILTLAESSASAGRGAVLAFAYCLGLGIPFVATALLYRYALGAFAVVKRHYRTVMAVGGGMLVVIGVLLITGYWDHITRTLQTWTAGHGTLI